MAARKPRQKFKDVFSWHHTSLSLHLHKSMYGLANLLKAWQNHFHVIHYICKNKLIPRSVKVSATNLFIMSTKTNCRLDCLPK